MSWFEESQGVVCWWSISPVKLSRTDVNACQTDISA